ncbi:hypothetical protein H920_03692 [Fukomys damarensis]|uniref:Uncharacterized protein n=1 Tax=Fukomys damarensis TaxID=885580 RepID=A0A091DXF6_FUKDA|nr:hypothetical protein H920_03692 [Fukomys damarensis]
MLCLEKLVGLLLKNQQKSDTYKKGLWKSQRYTVTGTRAAYGRLNSNDMWARKKSRRLPLVPGGIYSSKSANQSYPMMWNNLAKLPSQLATKRLMSGLTRLAVEGFIRQPCEMDGTEVSNHVTGPPPQDGEAAAFRVLQRRDVTEQSLTSWSEATPV